MSHRLDQALEEVDKSMSQLRQAMRGVPAYRQGFRKLHDQLARQAAELSVAMADARSMVNDD